MIGFLKAWLSVIGFMVLVAVALALVLGVPFLLFANELWWYGAGYVFLLGTLVVALNLWSEDL